MMAGRTILAPAMLILSLLCRTCAAVATTDGANATDENTDDVVRDEWERCGEIIDMHLHMAFWFSTGRQLVDELDVSGVSRGVLYSVYPSFFIPNAPDPNEEVQRLVGESGGRVFGLASLNTTGDWEVERPVELDRLRRYLDEPDFVGAKLAPPHTCLPLDGTILREVVQVVSDSSSPVLGIHVGTTPFCGPLGQSLGFVACCESRYVDPSLLRDLVEDFANVTFILLHSGFDFLPPGDPLNYNGTHVDAAIDLVKSASEDNVWVEISALHAQHPNGTYKYPGGDEAVRKIADAGLANRTIWGADANHNQGMILPNLKSAVEAMIDAGYSPEARCAALVGASREIFRLGDYDAAGDYHAGAGGEAGMEAETTDGRSQMDDSLGASPGYSSSGFTGAAALMSLLVTLACVV